MESLIVNVKLILPLVLCANLACAGRGAYIVIENNTPEHIIVSPAGDNCVNHVGRINYEFNGVGVHKAYLEAVGGGSCSSPSSSYGKIKIDVKKNGQMHEIAKTRYSISALKNSQQSLVYADRHYSVRARSYNIISRFSGQDILYIQIDPNRDAMMTHNIYTDWMGNLSESVKNRPLSHIVLPGTHDSFSNDLSGTLCNADPSASFAAKLPYFGISFAKAQGLNFIEQLERGIRYFDVRLCQQDGNVYTVHSLISKQTFYDQVNHLASFLKSHPTEIVILDLNHLYGFDDGQLTSLLDHFLHHYDYDLLSYNNFSPTSTLAEMQKTGKNLIVILGDKEREQAMKKNRKYSVFWPASSIESPWPNTTDINVDMSMNSKNLYQRSDQKLFVNQLQLTPDTNFILNNPSYNLEYNSRLYAQDTYRWLEEHKDQGMNIFITDFASGYGQTLFAIKANS